MSKKVEKFVKQICLNLLRKMSIYDIKYNRVIISIKRGIDDEQAEEIKKAIRKIKEEFK